MRMLLIVKAFIFFFCSQWVGMEENSFWNEMPEEIQLQIIGVTRIKDFSALRCTSKGMKKLIENHSDNHPLYKPVNLYEFTTNDFPSFFCSESLVG